MRVTTNQEKYLDEVFGIPDSDLADVRQRMLAASKERMSISSAEARILQFLIRGFQIKRIVEFGTLSGYSALAMAKALPEDGEIFTLEKDPEHHRWAKETFADSPQAKKVHLLVGEAKNLMGTLKGPFDMVFIDANKTGYVDYLEWAEKNVRVGGLIIGDNTFLWGALWEEASRANIGNEQIRVMREFNERLADPKKYNSTLIPTIEGLTVAQKLS